MLKKRSLYHFLIGIMLLSLFTPFHSVFAEADSSGQTGSLTIHKYEQEPGAEQGNADGSELDDPVEGDALEGVTFTLTQTHQYDSGSDTWTEVQNQTSFEETTNDQGIIEIGNIDLGRYKVQETAGPPNVVLNTQEYFVDIPMTSTDGSSTNYDVHIYPKNEIIRGAVTLIKYDGGSESALENVRFNLYTADGEEVASGLMTNSSGEINVGNLAFGDYYFEEQATIDGYLLNGEKVEFSIENQGEHAHVELANYQKPEIDKEVDEGYVNRGETVTFTLTVDLPGDIANYDNFVITDLLDDNLQYVDDSQSGADGFTFNQNGQTLTWTGDPANLSPGTISISFDAKVSDDATANEPIENSGKIDYNNGYETGGEITPPVTVTPTVGTLQVIKQDGSTEETLQGAAFDLMQEGQVVAFGVTNEDGLIDFGELDYGEYQLVETQAPDGYNKLNNPIDVQINAENQIVELTVDNHTSGWVLPKTGGIGTLLFTIIGLAMMAGSLVLYFNRRRNVDV